jgi:SpoU rRNA methylase family enzyme
VERQIGALGRVLGAAAPDGAAVVWKLDLIVAQRVFELDCWEGAVEVLKGDVRRLG